MNKLNWSYNAWRKENKWIVQKHKMTLLLSLGLVSYWLDIHEAQIENWGEMLFAPPDCYIHLHHALYFVLNTLFTGTLFRNGIMSIYNWMTIKKSILIKIEWIKSWKKDLWPQFWLHVKSQNFELLNKYSHSCIGRYLFTISYNVKDGDEIMTRRGSDINVIPHCCASI